MAKWWEESHLLKLFELCMCTLLDKHVELVAEPLLRCILLLESLVCGLKHLKGWRMLCPTATDVEGAGQSPMTGRYPKAA